MITKAMDSESVSIVLISKMCTSCNFLYLVLLLILSSFSLRCNALQSDIDCLRSIKESLEDPLHILESTWNFDNQTEGFICHFTGIDCWHPDESRVLSIHLPDMSLKGEFPRGIKNCSSLSSLDLSSNELHGTIPWDITKLIGFVVTLDLSSNQFSGEIPVSIANCSFLNVLKLDNNMLTGQIPPQIGLLGRVKQFSVANNKLTGPVPNFLNTTIPADSYANNPGLCGYPLKKCRDLSKWNYHAEFISGLVTGWSLFTLLGMYLFLFGFPAVKKIILQLITKRTKAAVIDGSEWPQVNNDPKISKLEKFVTRMSYTELAEATSNFSQDHEIGKGMIGKVYKALVPNNGWTVAIKRLDVSENLEEEFVSEITTLGSLRHHNLVPLIGFCWERDERLLVYKYMPNGNLYEWLHTTDDKARLLDFPLRIKIASGVAKALAWLHHHGGKFHVVHSNISTQCILLDENFDPKISNFWEATLEKQLNDHNVEESISLTLMPIVDSLDFTSYKKDVYRFGVVLLELLTRKESYQLSCSTINLSSSSFAGPLDVDRVLLGQGFDAKILQLLELAGNCMKFIPDQRPTMEQVYRSVVARSSGYAGEPEIQCQMY